MAADGEDDIIEMSLPADTGEEPLAGLLPSPFSGDQAHVMPQLFGWLAPDEQRERVRYLTDVTQPRAARPHGRTGEPYHGTRSATRPSEKGTPGA
jgi:hypothetical protein